MGKLREGFPDNVDTAGVLPDGGQSFDTLDGTAFDIFWAAYLGRDEEILISGRLADVAGEVRQARACNGWIMDTCLLRRR